MSDQEEWRRCSSCREPIGFKTIYWTCNVSTCNRKNTAFVFCSVDCWDAHLPTMNHREAWAEEQRSPSPEQAKREKQAAASKAPAKPRASASASSSTPSAAASGAPRSEPRARSEPRTRPEPPRTVLRRAESGSDSTPAPAHTGGSLNLSDDAPDEILVVASRLKDYVRARSGMNTSDRVLGPLSDILREVVDRAIANAHQDERKTVLDRDIPSR